MFRRIGKRSSNRLRNRPKTSASKGSTVRRRQKSQTENKNCDAEEKLTTKDFDEYRRAFWKTLLRGKTKGCECIDPLWFVAYKNNSKATAMKWISRDNVLKTNISSFQCVNPDPKRLEPEIRDFVKDIYKSQKIKEFDVVSDFPFKVPKVPQQKDGVRCGHYVLYYIYKFIMSCPEHFNVDKDYPSFLDKNWFTDREFETFCESLPSLVAQMLPEAEYISDKEVDNEEEFAKGEKTGFGKNVESENDSLQFPPVFEPFDALRALFLYSPDSSQEKPNTVLPLVSCANNDTPEAVEEIPIEKKNDKENSVSVITKSDFQCQEKTTKRKLKIKVIKERSSFIIETNDRAVEERTNVEPQAQEVRRQKRRDHKKLEEKRKSPRLMTVNAKSNDETKTNANGGKNKKASFTINDDSDSDFEETLPRKSPRKARGTTVGEKSQGKKRKNSVQAEQKNGKKQKIDKPKNESEKVHGMPKKLLI
ncbi:hypothetical protein POM88_034468 [Heracleum sosnowskyi]|uniref:Ubiquitin-like protease family profile domain-containing protein n=1 Tax=Heracleum sosnowskyi TaxID=360622 RepID=A0AAD8HJJ9_9APIA|nr:hypothetical protein POM88_034468 [Heracleum sosnowskyi]